MDAKKIAENPKNYYGKYVLNYSTDNEKTKDAVEKWQIFYSNEDEIFLIASDFIHYDYCPPSANNVVYSWTDYRLGLNYVYKDYNGSTDITDTRLQALNSGYYKYLTDNYTTSENINMRSVAYMMDTSEKVWGTFAGEKAEYAIGGPTIEMLLKSYSQKYDVDYRAQVSNVTGYEISNDGGASWTNSIVIGNGDTTYVKRGRSYAMWLASPSATNSTDMMRMQDNGNIGSFPYSNSYPGFRPLVCLKSDVLLKEVEGG